MHQGNKVEIKQEFLQMILKELEPLVKDHYKEVEHDDRKPQVNIDWGLLCDLEAQGSLICVTARADGNIVGYLVCIKSKSINYKGLVTASDVGFFVATDYRKSNVGRQILKKTEEYLKQDGVHCFAINGKVDHPIDPLMLRMGYALEEKVFSKFI